MNLFSSDVGRWSGKLYGSYGLIGGAKRLLYLAIMVGLFDIYIYIYIIIYTYIGRCAVVVKWAMLSSVIASSNQFQYNFQYQ